MRHLSFIFAAVFILGCQTQQASNTTHVPSSAFRGAAADAPASVAHLPTDAIVLQNKYFKTVYDSKRNIAYYSEYELTSAHLRMPKVARSNKFHVDLQLQGSGHVAADPAWYTGAGYDRGHLAPSADFNWDKDANYATFVMSNMTPQQPKLNRQAWAALEGVVRDWACTEENVEIVTGPVLEENLPLMGAHPIPIPKQFFKAMVTIAKPHKAIGFIMNQTDAGLTDYQSRVVTIDEIEKATGLTLFEEELEPNDSARTHASLEEWKRTQCLPPSKKDNDIAPVVVTPAVQLPSDSITYPLPASDLVCHLGTQKDANISGCCQGQHGVMGPHHGQACCDDKNMVLCRDGKAGSCSCN